MKSFKEKRFFCIVTRVSPGSANSCKPAALRMRFILVVCRLYKQKTHFCTVNLDFQIGLTRRAK